MMLHWAPGRVTCVLCTKVKVKVPLQLGLGLLPRSAVLLSTHSAEFRLILAICLLSRMRSRGVRTTSTA